jgi:hypothetical protein
MSEKKKPDLHKLIHSGSAKKTKELSFEHLGGKCILQPTAQPGEKPSKPIDFSKIGGRCI